MPSSRRSTAAAATCSTRTQPLFDDPESEAFKQLQWLQDAFTKHEIVAPETHEFKVIPAMNTGKHAFTVVFNYVLAAMNNAADQPRAGEFDMAPMPGEAHATLGFAKFYAMTAQAAADPQARAAWKFIEYMGGGDYQVAKRWAVEKGWASARCRCSTIPTCRRRGRPGSTWKLQGPGDARQERHLDRVGGHLERLFPAAARPSHGRRGERPGGDGRRRRQVARVP